MATATEAHADRLTHFPISFFAIVMGLGGAALALRASEHALGLDAQASLVATATATGLFVLIGLIYLVKAATRGKAVVDEWRHPVRIAFFPAISISLLLIAVMFTPISRPVAEAAWFAGAALQGGLTLAVVANWIGHRSYQPLHLNPAWFIPAVGNVVVPIAGAQLGYHELSWLFFSAGVMFWIVLLTLVFNRLVFHDPLPGRLTPTLVILIAPPAVAYISYMELMHGAHGAGEAFAPDPFARVMLNTAYVFAGVVLTQAPKLSKLPFALSWWALSFPVAALSIASLKFAGAAHSSAHKTIGLFLAALVVTIVVVLAVRTIRGIFAREICQPE